MSADIATSWSVFEAQVIATNPATGEVIVRAIGGNSPPRQISCVMAAPFFGYALGVRQFALPEINSTVIVLDAGTPAIIGVLPDGLFLHTDPLGDGSVTGRDISAYAAPDIKSGLMSSQIPTDMVPGEVAYQNALGVGWALLRTMAKMQAGPRAAIECFLTEELVRVISAYYRHIHAAGEIVSYDDGGANMIARFVENLEDALGAGQAQEKAKVNIGELNDADAIDGKWIAEIYAGRLGGYLNAFFTRPGNGRFDGDFSAGLSRVSYLRDGSVLTQSTADISLELVPAIPVPKRRIVELDKTTMSPEEKKRLETKHTADKIGNSQDLPYRLYEYARWLAQVRGLERFLQLASGENETKEYDIPSEQDTPGDSGVYATIRILRTGDIVILDGSGNSIVMDKTGVSISSVASLKFEAAKDIEFVAGRDLKLAGRKSVVLSSLTEKMLIYAKKAVRLFCSDGTIWLRSSAKKTSENLIKDCGILADAKTNIRIETEEDIFLQSIMKNIAIHARRGLFYVHAKTVNIIGMLQTIVRGAKYVILKGSRVCLDAAMSWLGRKCRVLSDGSLHAQNIYSAQSLHSRQAFSGYFAGTEIHGSGIPGYTPPTANQMGSSEEEEITEISQQTLDAPPVVTETITEDLPQPPVEEIYQTLSQQRLNFDAAQPGSTVPDFYDEANISQESKIDDNRFHLLGQKRIKFFTPELLLHKKCSENGVDENSVLKKISTPKITATRLMRCYKTTQP